MSSPELPPLPSEKPTKPQPPKIQKALIPSGSELTKLTLEQTKLLTDLVNQVNAREVSAASQRTQIAAFCFLACLGVGGYLVMQNHDWAGSLIFGTTVMGAVIQLKA